MQHVSMLDRVHPTQSERAQSVVLAVSSLWSWPKAAPTFEACFVRARRTDSWPRPPTSAKVVTMIRDDVTWHLVNAFDRTLDEPCAVPPCRTEGTQPESGGATWR